MNEEQWARTRVYRVLAERGPLSPRELRRHLPDLKPVTIRTAIHKLRTDGQVSQPSVYVLHDGDLVRIEKRAGLYLHEMAAINAVQISLKSATGVALTHQMSAAEAEDLAHRLREVANHLRNTHKEMPRNALRRVREAKLKKVRP